MPLLRFERGFGAEFCMFPTSGPAYISSPFKKRSQEMMDDEN